MRVTVEFTTATNQKAFLGWLSAQLTRPDIVVYTVNFDDADRQDNVGAFAGMDFPIDSEDEERVP